MSDTRTTYKGNCHCGTVRFTLTLPQSLETYQINSCNCSICTKNGYLLVYPNQEDFAYTQGEENLTGYRFATKQKSHRFCKTCGSSIIIDCSELPDDHAMSTIHAVNARLFQDIDLSKVLYRYTDGKTKLDPPYSID